MTTSPEAVKALADSISDYTTRPISAFQLSAALEARGFYVAPLPATVGEGGVERMAKTRFESERRWNGDGASQYGGWDDLSLRSRHEHCTDMQAALATLTPPTPRPAVTPPLDARLVNTLYDYHRARATAESIARQVRSVASPPAETEPDKLLDRQFGATVKNFEHVRTTAQLIAGLMRQVRRLEDEG